MDEQQWMDLAEEAGQLREALASRARIEQAKGIVLVLRGTSADAAYELLRAASMRHNVKLAVLAATIVDAATTDGPDRAMEVLTRWELDPAARPPGPRQRLVSASTHARSPSPAGRRRPGG